MSAAESYSRATRSSNLKLDDLEIGDLDWLIAAGMVQETLPTRLIRLRAEFDTISRSPYKRTLVKALRSYPLCRQELLSYCSVDRAPKMRIDDAQVDEIVVRVLDLFLDPTCPPCGGRGFSGGYGVPTIRCPVCRETGKRQYLWKNDTEEQFAGWLGSSMESMVDRALGEMRRKLRDR
jgi:hypothetical protein